MIRLIRGLQYTLEVTLSPFSTLRKYRIGKVGGTLMRKRKEEWGLLLLCIQYVSVRRRAYAHVEQDLFVSGRQKEIAIIR